MIRWKFRPTSNFAARLYGLAKSVSSGLRFTTASVAQKTVVLSGFLFRARKHFSFITVDIIELPGRLVSSVHDRRKYALPELVLISDYSKSGAERLLSQKSPSLDQLDPSSGEFIFTESTATNIGDGSYHSFGQPLPDGAYYLQNDLAIEVDGGVIFISYYSNVEPSYKDPFNGPTVTTEKVWLKATVKWSGMGPVRSVVFSEDEIITNTGYGFFPRMDAPNRSRLRLCVFRNSCFFYKDKLQIALCGLKPESSNSTVGAGIILTVDFSEKEAPSYKAAVIDESYLPAGVRADLSVPLSPNDNTAPYKLSGFDLPAVFAFTGINGTENFVASYRYRARKYVTPFAPENIEIKSTRIATCQVLVTMANGSVQVKVDYADSVCGLDSPLQKLEADRVLVQKLRDLFFLDDSGRLVRHRRMTALVRPEEDRDISQAAPHTLLRHPDIAILVTQGAETVIQKQSSLGFGPQEDDDRVSTALSSTFFPLCSTEVAKSELWCTYIENNTERSALVSIKDSGVSRLPVISLPITLNITTYQKEVLDENGGVLVGMGQVATFFDDINKTPKIAFKKGRFGRLSFKNTDTYSRFGTFYLASQTSTVRYGRIFS